MKRSQCLVFSTILFIVTLTLFGADAQAQQATPAVTSLTLINADTDQPFSAFDPFVNGATLNSATLPTTNLSVRANVSGSVNSVTFDYDDTSNYQTEWTAPYALNGDANGNYHPWTPALGSHTITARANPNGGSITVNFTVIDDPDGGGGNQPPMASFTASPTSGTAPLTVSFNASGSSDSDGSIVSYSWTFGDGGSGSGLSPSHTYSSAGTYTATLTVTDNDGVTDNATKTITISDGSGGGGLTVTSLTLINADTDQPIADYDPFVDDATLNLATLPTTELNVRANVSGSPNSVTFDYDATTNYRTEGTAPYALNGDANGNYHPWTPMLGSHTITARTNPNGGSITVNFTVINDDGGSGGKTGDIVLYDLPEWTENERFFSDEYPIKHPSLSLNGFDCGSNCSKGLGLKQVLENVYNVPKQEVRKLFLAMINRSREIMQVPNSRDAIRANGQRLQARAFVALAAYVLEKNGNNISTLDPSISKFGSLFTIQSLRAALQCGNCYAINGFYEKDAVKWATHVTNVARAMDLYLALENAFNHYDPAVYNDPDPPSLIPLLLSLDEKRSLLNRYTELIDDLEFYGGESVVLEDFHGVDRYDLEPGNWPLKVQLAVGYALLTWQDNLLWSCPQTNCDFDTWLQRAFKAAGKPTGTRDDRRKYYWNYQISRTNEDDRGKFFWAEGPYYLQYTLSEVVPFWHAARINNLLTNTDIVGFSLTGDPFFETWFTRPLEWLADLSTPDGKTPPLDDGNKHVMENVGMLRWTGDYGNASVGKKFAWISKLASSNSNKNLLPVEIAIPRLAQPATNPLLPVVGNDAPELTSHDGRQEVVVRRTLNNGTHYILLNGESDDAIARGEGHEQPDQLQLIYYVDDTSYLIDSGYDEGDVFSNSTWNAHPYHNVLTIRDELLLPSPHPSLRLRKVSKHANVDELYYSSNGGSIDILTGKITYEVIDIDIFECPPPILYIPVEYTRNVLFIQDPDRPYLIDLNAGDIRPFVMDFTAWDPSDSPPRCDPLLNFTMRYRGNSDIVNPSMGNGYAVLWEDMYESADNRNPDRHDNHDFFVQVSRVEDGSSNPSEQVSLSERIVRESFVGGLSRGQGIAITLLEFDDSASRKDGFTSVAFIRALPDGTAAPSLVQTGRTGTSLAWQYYVWQHSSSLIDVFAARSASVYNEPSSEVNVIAIEETGPLGLVFPASSKYGFARLVKQGSTWDVDEKYLLNLAPTLIIDPSDNLVITNINDIHKNPILSWTASTTPEVNSYKVHRCNRGNDGTLRCNWQNIASTTSTTYTDSFVAIQNPGEGDDFWYHVTALIDSDESPRSNIASVTGITPQ